MFLITSVTVVLCILIYVMRKNKNKSQSNLPPSLPSIPLLGSLPFLSKPSELHRFFTEKVKSYGSVYSFMAGNSYMVVINGHESIREALVKKGQDFALRKQLFMDKHVYNLEMKGILYQGGEPWKKNRIHSMAILKQFGYGDRGIMEKRIHTVLDEFIAYVKSRNGMSWDPRHILQISSLHVISRLMFGDKALRENEAEELKSMIEETSASFDPMYEIYPFLTNIPPFRGQMEKFRLLGNRFYKYLMIKIDESSKQCDDSNNFVQQYIHMTSSTEYDVKELVYIIRDLLGAGTETIAVAVAWALVLLGNRSNILEIIQKEIDSVVPKDRMPSLYDKNNLPYLEATMLEVLRYRTVAPLALPHITACDTKVAGYFIPCGTPIIINLWSAHMDPAIWKDPETFRPERFLDENRTIINNDLNIAFSMGKRACLGETLARQETFLYLAIILQQFNIFPPEGETKIIEDDDVGINVAPAPYQLRLVPRL